MIILYKTTVAKNFKFYCSNGYITAFTLLSFTVISTTVKYNLYLKYFTHSMAADVASPVFLPPSPILRNLFSSSYQDKKLNPSLTAPGFKKIHHNFDNVASKSWRSLVKYGDDLEYDYFAIIDRKSWKKYVHKEFSVKDSKVGLFYNAEEKHTQKRIEFNALEKQPDGKTPDIVFEWNEKKSTLSAELKSGILLSYISHLSGGKEREMEKYKRTPLFCFQTLYEQLVEGGTENTFDPHKTKLRFKPKTGKNATDVTIQSRTAGGLYQTFIIY